MFLRCVIAIPNLLISLAYLARAGIGASGGTLTVFSPGPSQALIYFGAYFLLIANGLGLLLLSRQKDERQLRELARTDSLTGLVNLLQAETGGEALVRADRALYRATRNGRDRVEAHAWHLAPFAPDGLAAPPGAPSVA